MLLSPIKFFVLQTLLTILILLAMFMVGKACAKNHPKNYLFLSLKIILLTLLSAILVFIIYATLNPKFTLSLMRNYWRFEIVENQIDYQRYEHELTACLRLKPNCKRVIACTQVVNKRFSAEGITINQRTFSCDIGG
jgi:hypothetical protein